MTETAGIIRKPASQLRRNWAKLRRNKAALVGGFILLGYIFTALFAPLLFSGKPSAPNLIMSLEGPSSQHPLGTDELGRSILGRIIWGSRVSLMIAIGVVAVGLFVGVPFGLISGDIMAASFFLSIVKPVLLSAISFQRYTGIFPCFFGGRFSRLLMIVSSDLISVVLVSRGKITAST